MAEIIKVTAEELRSTANVLDNLAGEYKDLYSQFFSKTSEMRANWDGEDNIAFIDRIEGFRDNFETMFKEIEEYSDYLKKAAQAYVDVQGDIIGRAKSLKN